MNYQIIGFDFAGWFAEPEYEILYDGFKVRIVREILFRDKPRKQPISNQLIIPPCASDPVEAHQAGLRFLCEIAWSYGTPIFMTLHGGGSCPIKFITYFSGHRAGRTRISLKGYEQIQTTQKQKLALGFYKDGISLNNILYQFLSFFKILNIDMGNGTEIKQWLKWYIENKYPFPGIHEELSAEDLSQYLWESGRCAIAHAYTNPVVDAASMKDLLRIEGDIDYIKESARYYMKSILNIPEYLVVGW